MPKQHRIENVWIGLSSRIQGMKLLTWLYFFHLTSLFVPWLRFQRVPGFKLDGALKSCFLSISSLYFLYHLTQSHCLVPSLYYHVVCSAKRDLSLAKPGSIWKPNKLWRKEICDTLPPCERTKGAIYLYKPKMTAFSNHYVSGSSAYRWSLHCSN